MLGAPIDVVAGGGHRVLRNIPYRIARREATVERDMTASDDVRVLERRIGVHALGLRVLALVVGLVILARGGAALLSPQRVMGFLGYTFASQASSAATLGEVRATYGGVFTVMGLLTALAAINPVANRGRILFVGLLWLGACAGRVFGASVDGSPGLFGWLSAAFELAVGLALVVASQAARDAAGVSQPAPTATPAGAPPAS